MCPDSASFGICVEACKDDSECKPDQGCCFNGCGHTCSALVYNCYTREVWGPEKRKWCCENKQMGCDCSAVLCPLVRCSNPFTPPGKCCPECPAEEYNCLTKEVWSEEKRKWCCAHKDLGCEKYNCFTDEVWSEEKQKWCCARKGLGCDDKCPIPSGVGICVELCSSANPCPPGYTCCSNGCGHTCVNTAKEYNCLTKEVWSEEKRKWCCANKDLGCDCSKVLCLLPKCSSGAPFTPPGKCCPQCPDCSTVRCALPVCTVGSPITLPGDCCPTCPGKFCGGIAGIQCSQGYTCVDDPNDSCDPLAGGADCSGICVLAGPPCGGFLGTPCPNGQTCQDLPGDGCDPANGGADCLGVCVGVDCSKVLCILPKCSSGAPFTPPGKCCPQCPDCSTVKCALPVCSVGSPITPPGECCPRCPDCSRVVCPLLKCSNQITPPGKCCPECTDCSTVKCAWPVCSVGSPITPPGECCPRCPDCSTVKCALPVCSVGSPITPPGECCPRCPDCKEDRCPLLKCWAGSPVTYHDDCCPSCPVPIPHACSLWFDGCNTCKVYKGQKLACTAFKCRRYTTPRCLAAISAPRCGGLIGLRCRTGLNCVDDPSDSCDPNNGGADCAGLCVAGPCGGIAGLPCERGSVCKDDPTDNCNPDKGHQDCIGICVPDCRFVRCPEPFCGKLVAIAPPGQCCRQCPDEVVIRTLQQLLGSLSRVQLAAIDYPTLLQMLRQTVANLGTTMAEEKEAMKTLWSSMAKLLLEKVIEIVDTQMRALPLADLRRLATGSNLSRWLAHVTSNVEPVLSKVEWNKLLSFAKELLNKLLQ
eukprot:NODE_202_length_2704_cov_109.017850_g188_i0.p1 GENE.NODE_202_length_2704_cov_109.017850_g188_i0~~NODE_202_length_2704_cov_109.017850_g188_i0.p1  ORF type:complete len:855 (+),score=163.21 NODE_202_length_2704_cov_109.017850_g188_i0:131-2566(+)